MRPWPSNVGFTAAAATSLALLGAPTRADAYEREGEPLRLRAPHPGSVLEFQDFTGFFFFGGYPFERGVPARPDNTGEALLRFGEHLDLDLYRRFLTFTYDANFVFDAVAVTLTEYDQSAGLVSRVPLARGFALYGGVRYQYDRPLVDAQLDYKQTDVTVFGRVEHDGPRLFAYAGVAGYAWNPSWPARPDNTGLALLRYRAGVDARVHAWLSIGGAVSAPTDGARAGATRFVPSEVDASIFAVGHFSGMDLRCVLEWDQQTDAPTADEIASIGPARPDGRARRASVGLFAEFPFDLRDWWKGNMRPLR